MLDADNVVTKKIRFQYGSTEKTDLAIGYGINKGYARCMAASIASICSNNEYWQSAFHIVTDGLGDDSLNRLHDIAKRFSLDLNIYIVDARSIFSRLPTQSHFPLAIYYRYLLPLLLPKGRILYLDSDIINLKPLCELVRLDLKDNIIAAVPDVAWMERKRNRALGLPAEHRYFNSGVILLDVEKWHKAAVFEQSQELLQSEPAKYRYPDQDALNVVLHGKVKYLGGEYNCLDVNAVNKEEIVFLHFAAHPKPWNIAWPISKACNEFNRNIYKKYESITPWSEEPLALPGNNKERKIYAKALWNMHNYVAAVKWYMKYIFYKIK